MIDILNFQTYLIKRIYINKNQKTLHDLILNILGQNGFRQNDVCETNDDMVGKIRCKSIRRENAYMVMDEDGYYGWYLAKDLKFISRKWSLEDLLMAMNKKDYNISLTYEKKQTNCLIITTEFSTDGKCTSPFKMIWFPYDLTKSVLDQESITEIIEVLS